MAKSSKSVSPVSKLIKAWKKDDDDTFTTLIRGHLEDNNDQVLKTALQRAFRTLPEEEAMGLMEDIYYEASYIEDEEAQREYGLVMVVGMRSKAVPNEDLPSPALLNYNNIQFVTPWYGLHAMDMLPAQGHHFLKSLMKGEVPNKDLDSPATLDSDSGIMLCFGVKSIDMLSEEELDRRSELPEEEQDREIGVEFDKELTIQTDHYKSLWQNSDFCDKLMYISHPYIWGSDDKSDIEKDLMYLADDLLELGHMRNDAYRNGLVLKASPHEKSHYTLLLQYRGSEVVGAEETSLLIPQVEFLLAHDEYLNDSIDILVNAMYQPDEAINEKHETKTISNSQEDKEEEEESPVFVMPASPTGRTLH
jgi:hypothetical protein